MPVDSTVTVLSKLIDPQVMSDMITEKVNSKVQVLPYAKLDTSLQGRAGDTITVPKTAYIGDAVTVAEGEEIPIRSMSTSTKSYTVKKAGIGGSITDEAALSGYGNPVGTLNNQMAKSITAKTDVDAMTALYEAPTSYESTKIIGYDTLVNAIDVFNEEENSEKVTFIHPHQLTQLRLDSKFQSKENYGNQIMVDGEVGMIANSRIKVTNKVKMNSAEAAKYALTTDVALNGTKTYYTKAGEVYTAVETPDVANIATYYERTKAAVAANTYYLNPIVKLTADTETEDETAALTIFLKRDTNVETERVTKKRLTEITGDRIYVVALTDDSKVVICRSLVEATV